MIGPNMGTMPVTSSVGDALFGRTRQRVLGLLFGRPHARFYLNEIVRDTQAGKGAIQRELESLIASGLIESQIEGRQRYFRASRQSPVFAEIEALVRKTFGTSDVLRSSLIALGEGIEYAAIYGSTARGTAGAQSDIDLLVIGDVEYLDLVGSLGEAESLLGRPVNVTVFSRQEWDRKLRSENAFARDVLSNPLLTLVGDVDELGKPRQDRTPARATTGRSGDSKTNRGGKAKPARRAAPRARS